jgi:hypothetical protein
MGREIYLGSYTTLEEAREVRKKEAFRLQGEFAPIDD